MSNQDNKPLITYPVSDLAIVKLREQYGVVPDAESKEGYELIKTALQTLVPLRTGVEKRRKELKKDALDWGRKVDSEAKRITALLLEIEEPLKKAKTDVDERKKREKEERLEKLRNRIEEIKNIPLSLIGANTKQVESAIQSLSTMDMDGFYEFTKDACHARDNALAQLAELLSSIVATENAKTEAATHKAEAEGLREKVAQAEKLMPNVAAASEHSQKSANTKATDQIIEEYLHSTFLVSRSNAREIALAILNNEIPCVQISISQSAA